MPDGDKMPLGLSGPWRSVFRSFVSRDSTERIEDRVMGALASDLRRVGGVPGLSQLVGPDVVRLTASRRDQVTDALALALNEHLALSSPQVAARALVERLVSEAALNRLDRMVHRLVGDAKYNALELHQQFKRVLSGEQMSKLIDRLLKHPNGKGLRKPNSKLRRLTPDALMETDLGDL